MRSVAIVLFFVASSRASLAVDALEDLSHAVELNEKPYRDLQLAVKSAYQIAAGVEVINSPEVQTHFKAEVEISIIMAGKRFRREESGIHRTRRQKGSSRVIHVFDGTTQRQFWENGFFDAKTGQELSAQSGGLISDETPSLSNIARPHMFLLETGCPTVPLSTYIRGHEAVLSYPNPDYFPDGTILETRLLDVEEFQGLQCVKILIDTVAANGTRHNDWELWLAKQRNLIPVRNRAFTYRWSKDTPVAESTVDDWLELRRGVWFPKEAHTDRYDSLTEQREGKQMLRRQRRYEVKSVSLEPETTRDTFTKVDFPVGTKVTVTKDGVETTR